MLLLFAICHLLFPPVWCRRALSFTSFPIGRAILCTFRPIAGYIFEWWGGLGLGGVGRGRDDTTRVSCYVGRSSLALDALHQMIFICTWCYARWSSLALDAMQKCLREKFPEANAYRCIECKIQLLHSGHGTHFECLGCIQKSQSEHFGTCTRHVSRCDARPRMAVGVKIKALLFVSGSLVLSLFLYTITITITIITITITIVFVVIEWCLLLLIIIAITDIISSYNHIS